MKARSRTPYEESLVAGLELKLACTILKVAEELGEEHFYGAIRLAKFVVIVGIKNNLLPSHLIIINHFGPYPWEFNLILENAKRIGAIDVNMGTRPYVYSLTSRGKEIADKGMLEIDNGKRKKVIETIEGLIECYPYNKYAWWYIEDKLITESYMIFAGTGRGKIRNLNGHKIVRLFKFDYQGKWTAYHSTLFHRFVALHADPGIKMYEVALKPMKPLICEKYVEPFIWKKEKPLRHFLKNRKPYDRQLSEDKIQTKNYILNKWEIMEAIWFYQVLTGGFPCAKEIGFLCLCTFRLKNRNEKMRRMQEKALRYSLNALEDNELITSFEGSRKRYRVASRHFWDEPEDECFSLPHPLDILKHCEITAFTIHNIKLHRIFQKRISDFEGKRT